MKKIYRLWNFPLVAIGLLGFSSALPFILTVSTLTYWLASTGISNTKMGLFAVVTLPYSLKFLWAPFFDLYQLPVFGAMLGRRRSWLLCIQSLLIPSLIGLGLSDPQTSLLHTALWAFVVALLSSIQDVLYEAYRSELLKERRMIGYGLAISTNGYRMGLWIAGAGSLYLANSFSWTVAYSIMALGMVVGMIGTLMGPEALIKNNSTGKTAFKVNFINSFQSFFQKKKLFSFFLFVFLYKIGDTVLNFTTPAFLLAVGFSKSEIVHVAKTFGIGSMVLGGCAGGALLICYTLPIVLISTCILHSLASLIFMLQALLGAQVSFLFVSMSIENFACGISQVALIGCFTLHAQHNRYTGTHYALISSFGALSRVLLSSISGWGADQVSWPLFYLLTAGACWLAILALHPPFRSKTLF